MFRSFTLLCASCFLALSGCGAEPASPESDDDEAEGLDSFGPGTVGGKADGAGADWPSNAPLPTACDLEPPVQVFFTPDDPTTTLELDLIDKVRAARKASETDYPEGQNPYRIRYAVYNLTHADIARKLVQAEKDGVDVQVLIESDQLAHEWIDVDDIFREGGLEVVLEDTNLDAQGKVSADLIGIAVPGLMHLKTRLFEMPGWSALLTGSLNPNGSAGANEENIQLIRDPALIARYAEGYEAVLHHRPFDNVWDDASPVNVLYSPAGSGERASTRMLRWISEEKEQVLLMVFSLRDVTSPAWPRSLVQVLGDKVKEGVPVVVITDRKQSDGVDLYGNQTVRDDWTEDKLRQAGIHVYEAINDASNYFDSSYAYAAMHHKSAILGRTNLRVITDASNWTAAALGSRSAREKNVETMLFIDSARLDDNAIGRRYLGQWFRVLDRYAYQSVERDGEPPASEIRAWLLGQPGWPTQALSFRAEAKTSMGEEIYVSGDHDVLGRWTQLHRGVKLGTTAETYPIWNQDEPVTILVGESFQYKLTAQSNYVTRWEKGLDRVGYGMPSVCSTPGDPALIDARWR